VPKQGRGWEKENKNLFNEIKSKILPPIFHCPNLWEFDSSLYFVLHFPKITTFAKKELSVFPLKLKTI